MIGDAGGECVVVEAVGDEVGDLGDEWVVHVIRHFVIGVIGVIKVIGVIGAVFLEEYVVAF